MEEQGYAYAATGNSWTCLSLDPGGSSTAEQRREIQPDYYTVLFIIFTLSQIKILTKGV
jgi:hypothetical protein